MSLIPPARRLPLASLSAACWLLAGCGGAGAPASASAPPASPPAEIPAPSPAPPAPPPTGSAPQPDYSPQGYQLVFFDEFDASSLDRTKWCTRYTWGGGAPLQVADDQCTFSDGGGTLDFLNDEQQRYRDFNSLGETMHVVGGGTLKLRATKSGPAGYAPYESAMIRSKLEFKPTPTASYYVTARVKLPDVLGTWPAWWLVSGRGALGRGTHWPPEIDIMEAPTNAADQPADTIRQGSQVQGLQTASRDFEFTYTAPGYDAESQKYSPQRALRDVWLEIGALWTAGGVCYFVDGVKTACETYNWVDNDGQPANAAQVILNLAIGGAWAGASGIDDARFPTQVEVDRVRVYRSPAS